MRTVLKINHERISINLKEDEKNLKEDEKKEFSYNHSGLINWR